MAFKFIGWCSEANHDKIWGFFDNGPPEVNGVYHSVQRVYIFWGARGKKNTIHFKHGVYDQELKKLRDQKVYKKGYREINKDQLLKIWPTFFDDVDMKLCFDVLANRVKA